MYHVLYIYLKYRNNAGSLTLSSWYTVPYYTCTVSKIMLIDILQICQGRNVYSSPYWKKNLVQIALVLCSAMLHPA